MFSARKPFKGAIYGSLAPNNTLFAKFCMTFAINSRPRRISFEGGSCTSLSDSGATIAGQKNRRKMNAPTAVYFASWNLGITAVEILEPMLDLRAMWFHYGDDLLCYRFF
jgi:hypothetical protein